MWNLIGFSSVILSCVSFIICLATSAQDGHRRKFRPLQQGTARLLSKTNSPFYILKSNMAEFQCLHLYHIFRLFHYDHSRSWSRKWQPTPVFLPGKFHGQWSLRGYSPGGSQRVKHDWAHTHTHTHTHTVGSMKYRYLIVVLICIALMVNDIDYLFVCILAIYISSLEKYLEKAMAPHSSILAWKILWMEEPGRLQSMGSLRVGHDWATSLSLFIFMHWRRKWQPTPVFLPGESQGRGSLVGCSL